MKRNDVKTRRLYAALALLMLASLLSGTVARGEDQNGGWPGDWLTGYRSARVIGMGGAFVGLADEPTAMVWNPAGMTQLGRNEVFLETCRYFEGTNINTLSFAVPGTRFPTLGLSILSLRSDDFQRTNDVNDDLGSFHEGETAYMLSASHNLHPRIAVGGNLRIVHQSIDEFSATGMGLDLGILAHATRTLRLGASVSHLGGPELELRETKEAYPEVLRGGAALELMEGRALITAEIEKVGDLRTNLRGGGEFHLTRTIILRAGFDGSSPAGGFSINLPREVRLDYGAGGHDLGSVHRFGVSWRFGGFFARSEATPSVISPLGTKSTTRFELATRTRHGVESWRLEISDAAGEIQRRFGGSGTPPPHVMWDGKTAAGVPLPDGTYDYRLVVKDLGGLETAGATRTIGIDTGTRQVRVPVEVVGK